MVLPVKLGDETERGLSSSEETESRRGRFGRGLMERSDGEGMGRELSERGYSDWREGEEMQRSVGTKRREFERKKRTENPLSRRPAHLRLDIQTDDSSFQNCD